MTTLRMETSAGHYDIALPELRDRMLGQKWTLEAPGPNGIADDVEAICAGAIVEVIRRGGFREGVIEREDALRHLLGEVVVLHRAYDPSKRHGSGSFTGYLYDRLRYRMLDYCRKVVRDLERSEPGYAEPDDDISRSHGAPGEVAGDRGDPGRDALRDLLEGGDRALLREVKALGLSAPPGARGRTPDARKALARLDGQRRARVERALLLEREARRPVAA